jgi:hypothetical protein
MTQYDIVLRHLQEHDTITTWEAIQEYGCTRLSEYIRQIRLDFIVDDEWIDFVNRYGMKSKYKKYIYKGVKNVS